MNRLWSRLSQVPAWAWLVALALTAVAGVAGGCCGALGISTTTMKTPVLDDSVLRAEISDLKRDNAKLSQDNKELQVALRGSTKDAKPQSKVKKPPSIVTDIDTIYDEWHDNGAKAALKYNGQWIQVTAPILLIHDMKPNDTYGHLSLTGKSKNFDSKYLSCEFPERSDVLNLKAGQRITVCGYFGGRDGGFSQTFKLTDCYLVPDK
jgi:tRNA_anti-like